MRVEKLVYGVTLPSYEHSIRSQRSHGHAHTKSFIHSSSTHLTIHRYIHSTIHRFFHLYDSLRPYNLSIYSYIQWASHFLIYSFTQQHADTWWVAILLPFLPADVPPPLLLCSEIGISMCPNFSFNNLHLLLIGVLMFYARIKCECFLIPCHSLGLFFLSVTPFCR